MAELLVPFQHHIIAKAASTSDIIAKKAYGADSIEWQIIDKKNNYEITDEDMSILPITSVHTALGANHWATDIDACIASDYISSEKANWTIAHLTRGCMLAEKCSNHQGFPVKVVVHLRDRNRPYADTDYAMIVGDLLRNYPHIEICFENVPGFGENGCKGTNSYPGTVSDFAKTIRNDKWAIKDKDRHRIGVVLDVCHMLNTVRGLRILREKEGYNLVNDVDGIEEFFKKDGDMAKIIHFNNSRFLGIKDINHSIPFQDDFLFQAALSFTQQYTPSADLVLEIREDDYNKPVNFGSTAELVRKTERNDKGLITTIHSDKYNTEFRLGYDVYGYYLIPTQNTDKEVIKKLQFKEEMYGLVKKRISDPSEV